MRVEVQRLTGPEVPASVAANPVRCLPPPERGGKKGERSRFRDLDRVPADGFESLQHERFIRALLDTTGLPTIKVSALHHSPKMTGKEHALAACDRENGDLFFFNRFDGLPPVAQFRAAVHEQVHSCCPFIDSNAWLFGGEENRQKAANHAIAIAKQSLSTNVYLSEYHKKLARDVARSTGTDKTRAMAIFCIETVAIMGELAFADPQRLLDRQEAQKDKLEKAFRLKDFVPIISMDLSEPIGIDQTLINLMPGIENVEDLRIHAATLKTSLLCGVIPPPLRDRREPRRNEWQGFHNQPLIIRSLEVIN